MTDQDQIIANENFYTGIDSSINRMVTPNPYTLPQFVLANDSTILLPVRLLDNDVLSGKKSMDKSEPGFYDPSNYAFAVQRVKRKTYSIKEPDYIYRAEQYIYLKDPSLLKNIYYPYFFSFFLGL